MDKTKKKRIERQQKEERERKRRKPKRRITRKKMVWSGITSVVATTINTPSHTHYPATTEGGNRLLEIEGIKYLQRVGKA